jgi:hypothetical protein
MPDFQGASKRMLAVSEIALCLRGLDADGGAVKEAQNNGLLPEGDILTVGLTPSKIGQGVQGAQEALSFGSPPPEDFIKCLIPWNGEMDHGYE